MDGARIANAAAALGVRLADITGHAGVDVLPFGGTKNGMLFGEAVAFYGDARPADARFVRKQCTQLPSKMRFVAAQFTAMYSGELWLRCASSANRMAARLAEGATKVPGVELAYPPDANEVFALIPARAVPPLQARYPFYVWEDAPDQGADARCVARWVISWDITEEDVDGFLEAMREVLAAGEL